MSLTNDQIAMLCQLAREEAYKPEWVDTPIQDELLDAISELTKMLEIE